MAKKKKKSNGYWGDLSDQQKNADKFYDYETKGTPVPELTRENDRVREDDDIDDIIGKLMEEDIVPPSDFSNLDSELLRNVEVEDPREYTDEDGKKAIDIGDYMDAIVNGELDEEILTAVHVNETTEEFSKRVAKDSKLPDSAAQIVGIREISIKCFPEISRYIIDDGIAPTSFVENELTNVEIESTFDDNDRADVEEARDYANDILEYIITLKHPTAIYRPEDFVKRFKAVKAYSSVRFAFFNDETYVYAYVIDAESIGKLHSTIVSEHETIDEEVSVYSGLALAAGRSDQVFLVNDDDYADYFAESDYNQEAAFEKIFLNDKNTLLFDDEIPDRSDIDVALAMLDVDLLHEVQSRAREKIKDIVGKVTLEEEYDIEFDEEDEEETGDEVTDAINKVTNDINEVLSGKADEPKDETALDKVMDEVQKEKEEKGLNALDKTMKELEKSDEESDIKDIDDSDIDLEEDEPEVASKKEIKASTPSEGGLSIPVIRKKRK